MSHGSASPAPEDTGLSEPSDNAAPAVSGSGRASALITASVLLACAGTVMVCRHPSLPTAAALQAHVSTTALPAALAEHAEEVLLVPFAALVVVFVRLTLGIRMLGPFRPILLALAFFYTGFVVGVVFMVAVFAIVACLRPRLRTPWLNYTSRLAILLITVVIVQVSLVLVAASMGWWTALQTAFFPIIVLCLSADGFARAISEEGMRSAIWRGCTTVFTAVLIDFSYAIPGVEELLIGFPELMLVEVAAIVLISGFLHLRLLERWNPQPVSRGKVGINSDKAGQSEREDD